MPNFYFFSLQGAGDLGKEGKVLAADYANLSVVNISCVSNMTY